MLNYSNRTIIVYFLIGHETPVAPLIISLTFIADILCRAYCELK